MKSKWTSFSLDGATYYLVSPSDTVYRIVFYKNLVKVLLGCVKFDLYKGEEFIGTFVYFNNGNVMPTLFSKKMFTSLGKYTRTKIKEVLKEGFEKLYNNEYRRIVYEENRYDYE